MMKPTIHLNGTPKRHLLEAYEEAGYAIQKALEKLAAASPNARDYYVQGPDAFGKAADEQAERYAKLHSVLADMDALAVHVSDG